MLLLIIFSQVNAVNADEKYSCVVHATAGDASFTTVAHVFGKSGPDAKNIFMFNSSEHDISTSYKNTIQTNTYFSCLQTLRCCINPAYKC